MSRADPQAPRHAGRGDATRPVAAVPEAWRDERTVLRERRRQLAPWSDRRTARVRPRQPATAHRPPPVPIFVDDSGRRRRAARLVGSALAVAVLGYVVLISLSLAGVPLVGHLAPPGLGRLNQPSGDVGVVTGPAVEVAPLPEAAGDPSSTSAQGGAFAAGASPTTSPSAVPTTVAPPTAAPTTTTTVHGRSSATTVPSPGSTVPSTDPGGGRRPDSPPGQG